jgi:hypothetical protein
MHRYKAAHRSQKDTSERDEVHGARRCEMKGGLLLIPLARTTDRMEPLVLDLVNRLPFIHRCHRTDQAKVATFQSIVPLRIHRVHFHKKRDGYFLAETSATA